MNEEKTVLEEEIKKETKIEDDIVNLLRDVAYLDYELEEIKEILGELKGKVNKLEEKIEDLEYRIEEVEKK